MSEYTVEFLKRTQRLNLDEGKIESTMIAWANGLSPRRIPDMDGVAYSRMQREYVAETMPHFYRRQHLDQHRMKVTVCNCDCICGDCQGLERTCDECVCEEPKQIGIIPRALKASHLIDAGDDPIRLTESIMGQDCTNMPIADFRTMHLAIMSTLRTGDIPLPVATPEAAA